MKTLELAEAQTRFPSVLRDIKAGNEVAITHGARKQTVAVIIPYEKWRKTQKRRLGTLEGKMSVTFASDFVMSDEELVSL